MSNLDKSCRCSNIPLQFCDINWLKKYLLENIILNDKNNIYTCILHKSYFTSLKLHERLFSPFLKHLYVPCYFFDLSFMLHARKTIGFWELTSSRSRIEEFLFVLVGAFEILLPSNEKGKVMDRHLVLAESTPRSHLFPR